MSDESYLTALVRLTNHCPECREPVGCGCDEPELDAWELEPGNILIACGYCCREYGTALGAVRHQCVTLAERLEGITPDVMETAMEEALSDAA